MRLSIFMTKVSICIPSYNQPESVRRLLDSIVLQKFSDYEVIITDDSETGAVGDVINGVRGIQVLKYYRNKSSLGSPENWNKAISLAQGEYIKIMHHDDWFFDEDSLGEFVRALDQNPGTNFAFCCSNNVTPEGHMSSNCPSRSFLRKLRRDPRAIFPHNFIGSPSATIFKNNNEIYFDSKLKWVVDIDFYARFLEIFKGVAFIDKQLVSITSDDPRQVTAHSQNNKEIELFEWFYVFNKIYKNSKSLPRNTIFFIRNLKFLRYLLKKYKVRSVSELSSSHFGGVLKCTLWFLIKT